MPKGISGQWMASMEDYRLLKFKKMKTALEVFKFHGAHYYEDDEDAVVDAMNEFAEQAVSEFKKQINKAEIIQTSISEDDRSKSISANELRLGNWVYNGFTGQHETISEISSFGVKFGGNNSAAIAHLNPIPLDEELMRRFGFEGTTTLHHPQYTMVYFVPGSSFVYMCKAWNGERLLQMKYVHQLQNLFYVLTGEELKLHEPQN